MIIRTDPHVSTQPRRKSSCRAPRLQRLERLDERAGYLQKRRRSFQVLLTDGFASRIPDIERAEDAPCAQRYDERGQPQPCDDEAVDQAAQQSRQQPERKCNQDRNAIDGGGAAHHNRAKDHDHANRQIDAGGKDHQRLRHAEDGDDGDLLEHHRKVERRKELARCREGEDQNAEQENDERNGRRVFVEEFLQAPDKSLVRFVEGGDGAICAAFKSALGRRGARCVVTHVSTPPLRVLAATLASMPMPQARGAEAPLAVL